MSDYIYHSHSKYPQRAVKQMIGFQIFCHRHRYHISAKEFCQRYQITRKELEKVELGLPYKGGPKWGLIRKVLEANNLKITLSFQHNNIN